MKVGIFATFMSPIATPDMITEFARQIEQMGIDSLWMGEHVVLFDKMVNPYPGSKDGKIPVPEGGGMLDTVATFSFLAGCTKNLRFGTGITLLPQRNPVYTAKEFATLDWLTNGRVDFGVGVGWCKEEVEACGYTFENRGARCDEFLKVLNSLWTEPVAAFSGTHFDLPACRMDPKPVQNGGIPVIIGGHTAAGFNRAAKYGDGWYGFQLNLEQTRAMQVQLSQALEKQDRKLQDMQFIITPPYQLSKDAILAYQDLGVDRLILHLGSQKPDKIQNRLEEIGNLMTRL